MELKRIFKYRNLWVGLAMLWIIFFHSAILFSWEPLNQFRDFGFAGVDICLFASGIGCYYSLEKDPDILRFLKRRFLRLAPVYYCFIIPWMLWKSRGLTFPVKAVIGNLLGIQSLISWDYHFNWYISALVLFYFALPYLKKASDSFRYFWQDLLFTVFLVIVAVPFWGSGNSILILSRIPVLYAGVVCAKMASRGYMLKAKDYGILVAFMAAGIGALWIFYTRFPELLWNQGMDFYPFALIVPGLCVFLSLLTEQMEKSISLRWINKAVSTVGIYSFEVYLVHIFLYENFMYRVLTHFTQIHPNLLWVLSFPVILWGTYCLNRVVYYLTKTISHTKKA